MTSPATSRLFDRVQELVVSTKAGVAIDVSDFDMEFKVDKDSKPKPNTASIQVFNLGKSTRAKIETNEPLTVRLSAGYKDTGLTQIYLGEIGHAQSKRERPRASVVTEMFTAKGAKELATTRIQVPIGAGTTVQTAFQQISKALGIPISNSAQLTKALASGGTVSIHPRAAVLSGRAGQILTDICKSAGLEWSIQDGGLQILEVGAAIDGAAVLLNEDTGLINSPTVDNKGILEAEMLMIPNIRPGVKVVLDSDDLKGTYRLTHCHYHGETRGEPWGIKVHGQRLGI